MISNAKIEGLEATLNMSGTDYNVALMVCPLPFRIPVQGVGKQADLAGILRSLRPV
jgi:hypothetical protein